MGRRQDRIRWFERRLALWEQNAEQLGLDVSEIQDFAARLERARRCYETRAAAMEAAREAVKECDNAAASAGRAGLRLLAKIRAEAAMNPGLWDAAGIKAPRQAAGPEAVLPPRRVVLEVRSAGIIVVSWQAESASDSFVVERRIEAEGFRFLAMTNESEFIDEQVPVAASRAVSRACEAGREDQHVQRDRGTGAARR